MARAATCLDGRAMMSVGMCDQDLCEPINRYLIVLAYQDLCEPINRYLIVLAYQDLLIHLSRPISTPIKAYVCPSHGDARD